MRSDPVQNSLLDLHRALKVTQNPGWITESALANGIKSI